MRVLFSGALLGFLMTGSPAWADFQIGPSQPASAGDVSAGPTRIILAPETSIKTQRPLIRAAPTVAIPIAHGFGNDVPLGFAARQIVPGRVKVTFGPGVDEAALVDWRGGRSWIDTLQAAVRPLGMRVVVRWMAVSIIRA